MKSHLTEDQISEWIAGGRSREAEQHLVACPECAAEVAGTRKSLLLFRDAEYLRVKPQARPEYRSRRLAVACLATAAVLLAVGVLRYSHQTQPSAQEVFLKIPYVIPPAPYERTEVVRMDVPVAALIQAGFTMNAAAADSVPADVLIGQDGRPLAVAFRQDHKDDGQ